MYTHWRTQIGPRLNAPNMMVLDSLKDSEIGSSSVGGLYFGPTEDWCILLFILFVTEDKVVDHIV